MCPLRMNFEAEISRSVNESSVAYRIQQLDMQMKCHGGTMSWGSRYIELGEPAHVHRNLAIRPLGLPAREAETCQVSEIPASSDVNEENSRLDAVIIRLRFLAQWCCNLLGIKTSAYSRYVHMQCRICCRRKRGKRKSLTKNTFGGIHWHDSRGETLRGQSRRLEIDSPPSFKSTDKAHPYRKAHPYHKAHPYRYIFKIVYNGGRFHVRISNHPK